MLLTGHRMAILESRCQTGATDILRTISCAVSDTSRIRMPPGASSILCLCAIRRATGMVKPLDASAPDMDDIKEKVFFIVWKTR